MRSNFFKISNDHGRIASQTLYLGNLSLSKTKIRALGLFFLNVSAVVIHDGHHHATIKS
jgi:hypothetical protein